jgi:hypothetical protein
MASSEPAVGVVGAALRLARAPLDDASALDSAELDQSRRHLVDGFI